MATQLTSMHSMARRSCLQADSLTHFVIRQLWADVVPELVIQLGVGHIWRTNSSGAFCLL